MSSLDIEHKRVDGADLLVVSGFLDGHTFQELESALGDLFMQERYRLIVDLAGVEFISSAGLGVLIGALTEATDYGGGLVLLNPSPEVMKVLSLLSMAEVIPVAQDRHDALAALTTVGS